LFAILSLGAIIRASLNIINKYPVGWDIGNYSMFITTYAKTWPYIPEILPVTGGIPATSDVLPFIPWTHAFFYNVLNLDILTFIKFMPVITFAFVFIGIYLLSVEIFERKEVGIFSAFLLATSKYDMLYTYAGYVYKTYFCIALMIFLLFFSLRVIKPYYTGETKLFNRESKKYTIFAGITLFMILSSHEFTHAVVFMIYGTFMLVSVVLERKNFNKPLIALICIFLLGTLLWVPVLVSWSDFYHQRYLRMTAPGMESSLVKNILVSMIKSYPSFPYGMIPSIFSVGGILWVITRKRGYSTLLLMSWLFSMYFFTKSYYFDIVFFPNRFMSYANIPLLIFAAYGIYYSLTKFKKFALPKQILPVILLIIILVVVFEGIDTYIKNHRIGPFLNDDIVEGMIWLKNNTPRDSVIFTTLFPYASVHFIPVIAERTHLYTNPIHVPYGKYREYLRGLDAVEVISLRNPEIAMKILQNYTHPYLFLSKWDVNHNKAINKTRLDVYYKRVFENREIIIYRAYKVQQDG
jgi:asparagine N-glycosylation enzyme membrane subunit Stt3